MDLSLEQLRSAMRAAGANRFYAKALSPNDNSKNQPYFRGDLSILNILPTRGLCHRTARTRGTELISGGSGRTAFSVKRHAQS
jgi:hypothetical protein